MSKLRSTGGEMAEAGTYWNFKTGAKVRLDQAGPLPGNSSHTYTKLPPMIILSVLALTAFGAIYFVPKVLMPLYEAYLDNLVAAYVIADYIFIGAVLASIAFFVMKDLRRRSLRDVRIEWADQEPQAAEQEGLAYVKADRREERKR